MSVDSITIRRWVDADAEPLHALILANLDHLRPWMAWIAAEPLSLAEREAKIGEWTRRWDDGVDFPYAIADGSGDLLGGCGLHRRIGPAGLEIGYWVRGDRVGRGIASRAVAALTEAAFSIEGVDHVEIHHDAANVASRRVPEKNGFELVGESPDKAVAPSEVGVDVTWRRRRTDVCPSVGGRDDLADHCTSDRRHAVGRFVPHYEREGAMEIINLGAGDGLPPVDWAAVTEKLDARSAPAPEAHNSRTTWLTTVNEDGSPHVTAVGALWLDGAFWFQTGAGTRKSHNVERDPRCSIAVSIRDADVVIEGDAARVTDPGMLARVAKAWADDGWPAEPDKSGSGITAPFNAPSQGPPPWNVYRVEPGSATVVLGTEPGGLTRFRF